MSLTDQNIKPLSPDRHDQIIELVNANSCFTAGTVRELLDEIQRLCSHCLKQTNKQTRLNELLKQGEILMPLGTAKRAVWITEVAKETRS